MFGCCQRQHSHAWQGGGVSFLVPQSLLPTQDRMFLIPWGFSLSLCFPRGAACSWPWHWQDGGGGGSYHPKMGRRRKTGQTEAPNQPLL